MKATRKTIPSLIEDRKPFTNDSGTLRGVKNPEPSIDRGKLDDHEKGRLLVDFKRGKIVYMVISYDTPIAWETHDGWVYKVQQELTQTSEQHKGLLYLFHPKG